MPQNSFFNFIKKRKYSKILVSNNFYGFIVIIIFFELCLSLFIYEFLYNSYLRQLKSQQIIEANRIENTLNDVFSETHKVMVYVGKQISLHGTSNKSFIEKVLINSSEIASKIKTIYSWSLFDWVDTTNHVVVNSQIGLVQPSFQEVHDSYIWKCPKAPWTLQLSHPTIGNTSGMWTIPAGVGIADQRDKYLGTLNVGFNIAELNNKIQQVLTSKEMSFIVLNEDLRIVLQSADNSIDPKSSYYRDILENNQYFKEKKGQLEPSISYKDIQYTYYKKMEDFPYIILTGFHEQIVQREFLNLILPRLLELNGVGCFCLFLLYFLRKKIFNLAKTSATAKEGFLQRINVEMKESIFSILNYSNILMKHLKGETKVIVTKERQFEFVEKIYNDALNLYTMTSNTLSLNHININNLIEESIAFHTETAFKKNIVIRIEIEPSLLPFYGDEFRLKQIVISLIFLAMDYSPNNSIIKISAINKLINKKMVLIIQIEDNGFSLNAEDIMRLSEKFPNNDENQEFLGSQLDFASIEKLIKLHNGTCYICNKDQRGKIIRVTLPYYQENSLEKIDNSFPNNKNIFWLSEHSKSNLKSE